MKRFTPAIFIVALIIIGGLIFGLKLNEWRDESADLIQQAQNAGADPEAWAQIEQDVQELPSGFPFSRMQDSASLVAEITQAVSDLSSLPLFEGQVIKYEALETAFSVIDLIDEDLRKLQRNVNLVPTFLLSIEEQEAYAMIEENLTNAQIISRAALELQDSVLDLIKQKGRILILLQNQNERRSTGGFVGSFVLLDFGEQEAHWELIDTYAFDRLVPEGAKIPAPNLFHDLSQDLSLRDANFWPHFPKSAAMYRKFFRSIGEKEPDTVLAINFQLIKHLLEISGPVELPKWGVTLTADNFDLGLQFLVESKVSGRYSVKEPVSIFANDFLNPARWQDISLANTNIDLTQFWNQKNILAHSQNRRLQTQFRAWNIDGEIEREQQYDNVLYFDPISIGANKSDRFITTEIKHDSKFTSANHVHNTLRIVRRHELDEGGIQGILNVRQWPETIQDLLSDELLWKLGWGQNRTVVRVLVPREAKFITGSSPSGTIKSYSWEDEDFQVLEIPLFVVPGEFVYATVEYETPWDDKSTYELGLIGTPGLQNATFLSTISTSENLTFSPLSDNVGEPQDVIDSVFEVKIVSNE